MYYTSLDVTYSPDESTSGFHSGEAAVSNLHGDHLGSWGHSTGLRLVGEVPRCNAGHVGTMGAWREAEVDHTGIAHMLKE